MNTQAVPARTKKVIISQVDFAPLQAKLPEWIEIELRKMEEEKND
jgi:hypothetical protein